MLYVCVISDCSVIILDAESSFAAEQRARDALADERERVVRVRALPVGLFRSRWFLEPEPDDDIMLGRLDGVLCQESLREIHREEFPRIAAAYESFIAGKTPASELRALIWKKLRLSKI